ncbi:hypothetical protein M434DRAFT_38128 [Hypoxylon sp. CO27-5]|nr:hypothetical protein M434DRAFT_38128 [Hypoxylon sp. CO27-5]
MAWRMAWRTFMSCKALQRNVGHPSRRSSGLGHGIVIGIGIGIALESVRSPNTKAESQVSLAAVVLLEVGKVLEFNSSKLVALRYHRCPLSLGVTLSDEAESACCHCTEYYLGPDEGT